MADGRTLIESGPYAGVRRVIDISGDGPDNMGPGLQTVRKQAQDEGIVVNGLAIESDTSALTSYYRDNVITGSGSFAITARDYADFARAIKVKLLRELRPIES